MRFQGNQAQLFSALIARNFLCQFHEVPNILKQTDIHKIITCLPFIASWHSTADMSFAPKKGQWQEIGRRVGSFKKNYRFLRKPCVNSYAESEMSDVPSCKQTPNHRRRFQHYKHTVPYSDCGLIPISIKSVMFYILLSILMFFMFIMAWNYKIPND